MAPILLHCAWTEDGMTTIDLNADCGESYGPWTMGDDAAILELRRTRREGRRKGEGR